MFFPFSSLPKLSSNIKCANLVNGRTLTLTFNFKDFLLPKSMQIMLSNVKQFIEISRIVAINLEMWSYLTSGSKKFFEEKEVQTIIQRKCDGDLGLKSDQEEKTFYTLLEYTPFNDIQEKSYKIINLPKSQPSSLTMSTKLNLQNCLLIDDDAISEMCLELRDRVRKGINMSQQTFTESGIQTDLHVQPHILEDEQVANVVVDCAVQTICQTSKSKWQGKGWKRTN